MSYQVFARKYRPQTFDQILGQDHVVQTLKNAIRQSRLAHAYLFVGPRGTGKTSTARILAKALNCPGGPKVDFDPNDDVCREIAEGRSLDVLEIDGASNNSVDQIRELRENVKFAPTRGQFRIYYIDEVHMLTGSAFNALLKTLEEPPPHAKFIFATTEAHKVLPTIISRCQRFDLRRIPDSIIADHLLHIAEEESVKLDPLAAHAIAKGSEGGMRDAQSMLDQLVAFCGESIAEHDALEIFGFTAHETIASLAGAILARDTAAALDIIHRQSEAGKDLSKLLGDLIIHFRAILVRKAAPDHADAAVAPEIEETVREQTGMIATDRLLTLIDILAEGDGKMRWNPNKKLHFEVTAIRAIESLGEASISDVIAVLAGAAPPPDDDGPSLPPPARRAASAPGDPRVAHPPPASKSSSPSNARRSQGGEPEPMVEAAALSAPDAGPVKDAPGLEGAELWAAALEEIKRSKPLLAPWAAASQFLEARGRSLVIGFHPDDRHKLESVERPGARDAIREIVSDIRGADCDIKFVLDESVAPQEAAPVLVPDDEGEDEPAPAAENASAESTASTQPDAAPQSSDDDSDDLIEAAITTFKGKRLGSA